MQGVGRYYQDYNNLTNRIKAHTEKMKNQLRESLLAGFK